MIAIVLKELKLGRRSLTVWLAITFITATLGALEYEMVSTNAELVTQGIDAMARIVRVMFGIDGVSLTTALDYYLVMYFWYALIAYAHAVSVGSSLLSKEERDKTAEYLYTKPYSRGAIINAKLVVGIINVAAMALLIWLTSVFILVPLTNGREIMPEIAITTIGLFLTQLLFLTLGLLCSTLVRNSRKAVSTGFYLLLATYLIAVAIEYLGTVDYLSFLTPFHYFNALVVVKQGISPLFLLLFAIISALSISFSHRLYNTRDLLI
ncbi:MAG: ABC transporter permease subunit [Bacillota bacterium]|nr:ABC transporter permease subunit [Bacillota bacterium]